METTTSTTTSSSTTSTSTSTTTTFPFSLAIDDLAQGQGNSGAMELGVDKANEN